MVFKTIPACRGAINSSAGRHRSSRRHRTSPLPADDEHIILHDETPPADDEHIIVQDEGPRGNTTYAGATPPPTSPMAVPYMNTPWEWMAMDIDNYRAYLNEMGEMTVTAVENFTTLNERMRAHMKDINSLVDTTNTTTDPNLLFHATTKLKRSELKSMKMIKEIKYEIMKYEAIMAKLE